MPALLGAGGKWVQVNDTYPSAVMDGNLVTASAWPALPVGIRRFLEPLGTKIEP